LKKSKLRPGPLKPSAAELPLEPRIKQGAAKGGGGEPPGLPPKVDIRGSENEQNKQNPVTDLRTAFFFLRHAEKYTTAGKRLISDWCVS
jgi:hypothetical protein